MLVAAAIACAALSKPVRQHTAGVCPASAGVCGMPVGLERPSSSLAFPRWKRELRGLSFLLCAYFSPGFPTVHLNRRGFFPQHAWVFPCLFQRQGHTQKPDTTASPCLAQTPGPCAQISSLPSLRKQRLVLSRGNFLFYVACECLCWPRE